MKVTGVYKKIVAILLILCSGLITGCSYGHEDYTSKSVLMGTFFTASFRAKGSGNGQKVWDDITNIGESLENDTLSWRIENSEIAKINQSAGSPEGYPLSEKMEEILTLCLDISRQTNGAFDISIGNLTRLWNIDESADNPEAFRLPTQEEVEIAKALGGYEKIKIDNHRIYMEEGVLLDLGAVGKGILLDECLVNSLPGTSFAVVAAGGSILTYGQKGIGYPWNIAIVDPFDSLDILGRLRLKGSYYVATSGDYERFVEYEGVRYHHIIDPQTGYPADAGVTSVTVVIQNENAKYTGLLSDALSTAIFVLGEKEGIEIADKYGADIIIVRKDGSKYISEGLSGIFE